MTHILHLDSSILGDHSVSRAGSAALVERLLAENPGATVTTRDVSSGEPLIDGAWAAANGAQPEARTDDDRAALAHSDRLLAELKAADIVVIGTALYNFSIPAGLKSWIDQIARRGVAFRYTADGPEGLLKGKRAIVAYASGGTPIGAPYDFATPYLRHMLGFIGISDVEIVSAAEAAREEALAA